MTTRPHTTRATARILAFTRTDPIRILLLSDSDLGVPQAPFWMTPGGGIDPGETPALAAIRELAEETGRVVTADQLFGPVAERSATHGYSDKVVRQTETFFCYYSPDEFDLDTSGHTDDEKLTVLGHRWFSRAELIAELAAGQPVWPSSIVALFDHCAAAAPTETITIPDGTESTVDP